MKEYLIIEKPTLGDICDAVREKEGSTEPIPVNALADRIGALQIGGGENKLIPVLEGTVTELTAEDLKGLTKLGENAFAQRTALIKVELPDSVVSIDGYAFQNTGLTDLTIGKGLATVNHDGFSVCRALQNVYYNGSLVDYCNITFTGSTSSPFTSTNASNTTLYIKQDGAYKPIENIVIPSVVTEVKNYTFQKCLSLKSVVIEEGATRIGIFAFYSCSNITNVIIPKTVTEIGTGGLNVGSSISSKKATLTFLSTNPPTLTSTLNERNLKKIIVPKGCAEAYKTATNWSNVADYIEEATE